ncbi:hypothetical protein N7468_004692 [Penicillium chermesinum]|uniref:Uncharacterized protein n=1 Tax=Penicillium chermesinum TaxID=63820 RepID=A0A9W9PBA9_9EURO|nr:uncharacterized protein N7468_004692 [Penicillium chermesinum]KAJ5240073.1 hypothetical protein N7468_004692 [Penicillium chermesinum]
MYVGFLAVNPHSSASGRLHLVFVYWLVGPTVNQYLVGRCLRFSSASFEWYLCYPRRADVGLYACPPRPPLPWKRRPSTKGKEKEERPDVVDIEFPASIPNSKVSHNVSPEPRTAKLPNPSLPGNGSSSLQVAVKQSPDRAASDSSGALPAPDPDLSSGSQACLAYVPDLPRPSSPPPQLTRAVSWASIVRSRSRWTVEQERELARAEEQLTRCQKAWSSEQELWITYVCLHLVFLLRVHILSGIHLPLDDCKFLYSLY